MRAACTCRVCENERYAAEERKRRLREFIKANRALIEEASERQHMTIQPSNIMRIARDRDNTLYRAMTRAGISV